MVTRRAIQSAWVLFSVAGCRPATTTAPGPAVMAPAVTVHATVSGGGMSRMVAADFSSQRDAYVLVGHVGGNGRIDVLFPDNGKQQGFIRSGTRYQIPAFPAGMDANPSMYSLTRPPQRNAGARLDSYDGRGSAFIFIVSSDRPLNFEDISDEDGEFVSYIMPGYWYELDPRQEIDRFAREVADGNTYRVEYAYSYGNNRYASYSDRMMDCAMADYASWGGGFGSRYGGFRRPWLWNYFGNDIGFWNLYDDYAGMGTCGRSYWLPGVYAFGTSPTESPRSKAYVRVLHRPLVTDGVAYRSRAEDRFADQDRRPTTSRSSDYSTRRTSSSSSGRSTTTSRPATTSRPSSTTTRSTPRQQTTTKPHKQ